MPYFYFQRDVLLLIYCHILIMWGWVQTFQSAVQTINYALFNKQFTFYLPLVDLITHLSKKRTNSLLYEYTTVRKRHLGFVGVFAIHEWCHSPWFSSFCSWAYVQTCIYLFVYKICMVPTHSQWLQVSYKQ